ncbi:peptidoglycan DD-metalloendopeptidase family protein [Xylophilus ampelinus]|uniref:LysM domain-containing protein n=1 Tax=Xylophilus ampelinus TaxID=54067 RepID=A0A318STS0_9BURK|nr:peptidoglycan DD-metalloendopeptidase family protein [Xylophilus ampelinus]MCS4510330.1 peptidoglycan DD-metalloendopeptidase family protein [Xylophilus ampelinus]PYE78046.1 LysM domain-containing protein [Xylophilus ampelinus]
MLGLRGRLWLGAAALAVVSMFAGCSADQPRRAPPVEDRGLGAGAFVTAPVAAPPAPVVPAAKPLPGIENAGRPGFYTVKPGDTIRKIGSENGVNWRDIVRLNNLDNPDLIEVGQVLRISPSAVAHAPPAVPPAAATPSGDPVVAGALPPVAVAAAKPAGPPSGVVAPVVPPPGPSGEDEVAFIWPASGTLLASFDEAKNKGYDIGGKAGDPVLAAADGRVVYAGAGLRGYGNLVILKHNNTYLTAYAHNQSLMVKEDQTVRKGQKIAEMGNSDADRVKLHFEIRRQGKPVDPSRYLAAR